MTATVVALVAVGVEAFLATVSVLVQRATLRRLHHAIAVYKGELHRAQELMAVMAREDVSPKKKAPQ